jgi:hypothetical protein
MSVADTFLSAINKDTEGKNTAHKLARFGLWRKTKCNRLAVGLRSASLSPNNTRQLPYAVQLRIWSSSLGEKNT